MIKGTVKIGAFARQVMCVAGLLLVEARIVREPFVGGRLTDQNVETVKVFVECDESIGNRGREVARDVSTINASNCGRRRWGLHTSGSAAGSVDEIALVAPATKALRKLALQT